MSKRFNKTHINFWLDSFLLLTFLLLCWSSVVIRYVFPTATRSEGWQLWGLDYLAWTDIRFATLSVLTAAILLHVMLHWTWVCGVVENWLRKRRGTAVMGMADTGSRTLWGVSLLIVLLNVLGLGIAAAALSIQGPTPN
jgi:hypothetical protein